MSIPNEILAIGGDPQPNPEPAPMQINNLSDAGVAFLSALSGTAEGTPPAEGEILTDQEGNFEIPAENGVVIDNNIPPAVQPILAPEQPVVSESGPTLDEIKNAILSEIKSLQIPNAQPQGPEGQTDTRPEGQEPEIDITDDAFMEKFGENPVGAVKALADRIADQKVAAQMSELMEKMKPVLDQSEQIALQQKVKDTLMEFSGNPEYVDAEKYFPQMAEYIKSNNLPQDSISSYETAYLKAALADARAVQQTQPENQGRSLEDYLADNNEVSKITGNEKIKNAIITEYLTSLANKAKPQVISGNGNVLPPATPPNKITDFREANKMLRSQL
jgi:hypothetical protein